ncbi:MAG: ammonium transporter [Acidimicrobiales bacterium]
MLLKRKRRLIVALTLVGAVVLFKTGVASASNTAAEATEGDGALGSTELSLNLLWLFLGAVLVIFMQAGFALVETGFCRAKHAAHVVSTNFAVFGVGFVAFFIIGFPLAFGGFSFPNLFGMNTAVGDPLIGSGNGVFAWWGGSFLGGKGYDVGVMAFFLYMVAFMDTTATIPTGAMAERWKWNSFVIWGLFCGGLYYPLFAAWTWGGGWLAKLGSSADLGYGYVDFAGSGVVHMMGGIAALAGAKVLGPRIGKYGPDGKPRTLAAHHIPMAMLGTFILLFGWFGFNAASTFAATDNRFVVAGVNTAIAAAFGAVAGMFWNQIRTKEHKPDPGMMANGMLGGLVAITAPCAFVQPWAAMVIGIIAAIIVVESVWFWERKAKIDDPVGAISVHGIGGLWGVLSVGLFADGSYGAGWNGTTRLADQTGVYGLFYGHSGASQLGAQAIGAATIIVVMGGIAYGFFFLQNKFTKGGIRPTAEVEMEGMDIPEMGVLAYPEFYGSSQHVEMSLVGGGHQPPGEAGPIGQETSR